MSIDTLNAYCGPRLVRCPRLAQGRRLILPPPVVLSEGALGSRRERSERLRLLSLSPWPRVFFFSLCRHGGARDFETRTATDSRVLSSPGSASESRFPLRFGAKERSDCCFVVSLHFFSSFRPESRRGDPPNLSILISGGKENNRDALSNGE